MLQSELKKIMQQVNSFTYLSTTYYNIFDFLNLLEKNNYREIYCDETILMPYYLDDTITFELYDYELDIMYSDFELYLLEKCGVIKSEKISSQIINKRKICYIQLSNKGLFQIDKLKMYLKYLLESEELFDRILKTLNSNINKKNFWLEIY